MKIADLAKAVSGTASYDGVPWDELQGSTVLLTGATGMVGSHVLACAQEVNKLLERPIRIVALVRDMDRAALLLGQELPNVEYVVGDITRALQAECAVDYIIHAAAVTDSATMSSRPVEVIDTMLLGTKNILEFARMANVKKLVYLSSMEVYGSSDGSPISESDYWTVDPMSVRSCYPEAKKMSECYCASYCAQHGVPAVVARLAQTFGPGVREDDRRVFAYFARCARDGEDIVLRTPGTSSSMYVYTPEAAAALFVLLAKGEAGQAYNVANPATYCSIYEMAELVRDNLASDSIEVRVEQDSCIAYPPDHHWNLSIGKIEKLGWEPKVSLIDMYKHMMSSL